MAITSEQIKKLMLDYKLLEKKQLDDLIEEAQEENVSLQDLLVQKKLIASEQLGQLIADLKGVPFVSLRKISIPIEILKGIPESVAENRRAIIFGLDEKQVKLALNDLDNVDMVRMISRKYKRPVKVYYATLGDIDEALLGYKKGIEEEFEVLIKKQISEVQKKVEKGKEPVVDLPVIKIVDTLMTYAYNYRASDIHIEPHTDSVVVRFRVDGILQDVLEISKVIHRYVVSRIKVLSKLRTDEHMAAQDGKFRIKKKGYKVDVRVSIIPITEGEKVVMRLLTERARLLSLADLGFSEKALKVLRKAIKKPHGMILATGPTGSGKTTTLYAITHILNKRSINISTIEDPVEYDIEGVNQIQVNLRTNLTFAKGLRSIVRQDPDIILVGEIRDNETVGIAVNAALTGHLVLSTLHTNDAATTIPRLRDMKVEPFLIASTVNVAIAQRLVRRICPKCIHSHSSKTRKKEMDQLRRHINIKKLLNKDPKNLILYEGKGCAVCKNTGYAGRIGLFEIMEISDEVKDLIMRNANSSQIRKLAIEQGMITLLEDGLFKAVNGLTTVSEILRVAID